MIDVLLDGGADPTAGIPSAVETARMFGLDDLVALFEGRWRALIREPEGHPPCRSVE